VESSTPLAAELFSGRAAPPAEKLAAIEKKLWCLVETARAAWPSVELPAADFVRHIGKVVGESDDYEAALDNVMAPDLYLAAACAAGLRTAIAEFDRVLLSQVPSFLAGSRWTKEALDDVRQALGERLLTSKADEAPKIAEYSGRGPLALWVRVTAVRTALNFRRGKWDNARRDDDGKLFERLSSGQDPELEYLRTRYANEFKQAFQTALEALPPRDRLLLKMYVVEGHTVQELGQLHQVHVSTISRRLGACRERLLQELQRALRQQLALPEADVESLYRLVQSRIDLSMARLLSTD
jgi:RNA polymerase sigma-70 factor (ECF subfamily)